MGIYKKGILGSFSGKVGTVVGSTWNGIDYMRSLPKPSSKAPTDAQMVQRIKFALATGFVSPIRALLNLGYKEIAKNQTGVNVATAQVIADAITGIYPDLMLDYSKVLISKGNLTGAFNAVLNSAAAASLTVSWPDNSGSGTAKETDTAILLIYNAGQSQYVYTLEGAMRSALSETLSLPASFSGDTVEVWISFITADRKTVATSIYAGNIIID